MPTRAECSELTPAKERFYHTMHKLNEITLAGAGLGDGFADTNELHGMMFENLNKSTASTSLKTKSQLLVFMT